MARWYWFGQSISARNTYAAWRGQYGWRSISLASSTTSACPVATICSACTGCVIKPTAPVGMPTSFRMAAAKGTLNPGPAGIFAYGTKAPLEQSIRSTPTSFSFRQSSMDWAKSHPPSTQSVQEIRTKTGRLEGQTARTASAAFKGRRIRFSKGAAKFVGTFIR